VFVSNFVHHGSLCITVSTRGWYAKPDVIRGKKVLSSFD
jgi:hypothetical protein